MLSIDHEIMDMGHNMQHMNHKEKMMGPEYDVNETNCQYHKIYMDQEKDKSNGKMFDNYNKEINKDHMVKYLETNYVIVSIDEMLS